MMAFYVPSRSVRDLSRTRAEAEDGATIRNGSNVMQASDTALIIIDAQESFRHRDYWDHTDVAAYIDRQQVLFDGARKLGIAIAQVFHVEPDGVFSLASGHVRTLAPLAITPDATFHKTRHSALVGSGLPVWLTERGIRRLIVSGIRTEQCCETTTRHASDSGYEVDFVSEATLTFAMTDDHGRRWSAQEIKARTELVLADRFARIATVEQALAGASMRRAA
jgi:nicotinamidase-related amidase